MAGPDPLAFEDSDDDFKYEEVDIISDDEDADAASEDLDAALRSLQALTTKTLTSTQRTKVNDAPQPGAVTKKPEVMDDFLRNFFVKMGLTHTCEAFEAEWYELKATGRLETGAHVPDVYLRNAELEEEVAAVRRELAEARAIAGKASATWDTFRKERDFHRMHHKRVAQEKNKLITDIRRLKEHFAKYEPTILELKRKYEAAMKEKMLSQLERDKLISRVEAAEATLRSRGLNPGPAPALNGSDSLAGPLPSSSSLLPSAAGGFNPAQSGAVPGPRPSGPAASAAAAPAAAIGATAPRPQQQTAVRRSGWSTITSPAVRHPYADVEFAPIIAKSLSLQKTFKGHLMSVAALALHPSKPILVTASDDKTWKMWHMPAGDLIMCGEGHKDWVAGVDFHPSGTALASGGGDAAVKLWDFAQQRCVLTFTEHKQAVWGVSYHHAGDVLASCSLDHTVRLWDVPAAKCRMVLRGHVDSVNHVSWQPFSSALATASSDKTVSIWDARSGLCTQTFYGHMNSCNAAVFNLLGTVLASTDADGALKLWDTRMVAEILSVNTGKHPANKAAFDRSGQVLSVACDDGRIRMYNTLSGELITELTGHEDAVQAVAFDPAGAFLVSCGSDNTFRVWS
ncbi:flagellar WD repeat-containing protein Pf20 [Haematococcus lacustris]|nr:hypothetical protein QJQ45_003761 [Haematococcus lacustris]KAJ9533383.1 hypothetical protein QJQ45_026381 [Haematococcus lacustris]